MTLDLIFMFGAFLMLPISSEFSTSPVCIRKPRFLLSLLPKENEARASAEGRVETKLPVARLSQCHLWKQHRS